MLSLCSHAVTLSPTTQNCYVVLREYPGARIRAQMHKCLQTCTHVYTQTSSCDFKASKAPHPKKSKVPQSPVLPNSCSKYCTYCTKCMQMSCQQLKTTMFDTHYKNIILNNLQHHKTHQEVKK